MPWLLEVGDVGAVPVLAWLVAEEDEWDEEEEVDACEVVAETLVGLDVCAAAKGSRRPSRR